MRELRRLNKQKRQKSEFQPITEDMEIVSKRRAETRKGKVLLEAMGVDKELVQDKSNRMVVCGADVEALYPSLSDI